MSKMGSCLIGATALVVSLGAAQFAVGHDLSGSRTKLAAAAQSDHVNRSAKADRPAGVAAVPGSTIVTKLSDLNDSSVVIRMPRPSLLREGKLGALREGKLGAKVPSRPVACEAPASVLTEVAKQLESGRCLT